MKVRAHAKLNLSLRVRGVRPDGFHEIESLVQTIDLSDRITLEATGSGVEVDNDLGVPDAEDLTARAAHLLFREKRPAGGVRIVVRKGIPAGAGLGGGSSDAAAVLVGLDRLTPPRLPRARLGVLAGELGSDVPLFLTGGRVRIAGRGERVASMAPVRGEHFVLCLPPISCDTRAVYEAFDRLPGSERTTPLCPGENDLWPAARSCYPELSPYAEAVAELAAVDYSGMSGSGAAFYSVFGSAAAAEAAGGRLAARFPEARIVLCVPTCAGQTIDEGDG